MPPPTWEGICTVSWDDLIQAKKAESITGLFDHATIEELRVHQTKIGELANKHYTESRTQLSSSHCGSENLNQRCNHTTRVRGSIGSLHAGWANWTDQASTIPLYFHLALQTTRQ